MDTPGRIRNRYSLVVGVIICLGLTNGYINRQIAASPGIYWSFELLYWVLIPVLLFIFAFRFCALRFDEMGISRRIFGVHSTALVVLASIAFAPLSLWWYRESYLFFHACFSSPPFFAYQMVMPHEPMAKKLVSVYFALTAGVVEEGYYRGLFFRVSHCFSRPRTVYVIVAPLLFSLVHWEGGVASMLAAYSYGVLTVSAFLLMRNLWPLMIGHVYTDYVWFSG